MCFFRRGKTAQINNPFLMGYLGLPRLFSHPFFIRYSFKSMFIGGFAICSILPIRTFAKIFKSIVSFIPINMINLVLWPFARHIKPRQSVGCVIFPFYLNMKIPAFMKISGFFPNSNFRPGRCPCKYSCKGVIIQNGFKIFMCDHEKNIAMNDLGLQRC